MEFLDALEAEKFKKQKCILSILSILSLQPMEVPRFLLVMRTKIDYKKKTSKVVLWL